MDGLSLAAAWVLGLSVGLTACAVSCLPVMGSLVLARAGGAGAALGDTAAFLGGRVAGYGLLGGIAGGFGGGLMAVLEGGTGHVAVGLANLLAAGLLLREARPANPCGVARRGLPPFALGAALALVPCAPLATLVAAAATTGQAGGGLALGLSFGLGAAVTPLLLALPALGGFARLLRGEQPWLGRWLRWSGAALLALMGIREFL